MTHTKQIVTWQSPSGDTLDICTTCRERFEAAGKWPKDSTGQNYCNVSFGQHSGTCGIKPTYKVLKTRVDSRDQDELTLVATLKREDGIQGDVWVCAGIPESVRDEVYDALHGVSSGYDDTWPLGDSLDCWCPPEFANDADTVFAIAGKAALTAWHRRLPILNKLEGGTK